MNLYLVSRTDSVDYDQYDSFVVAAESEEQATYISPTGEDRWDTYVGVWFPLVDPHAVYIECIYSWVKDISTLKVECIGTTELPLGTIPIKSFNAG